MILSTSDSGMRNNFFFPAEGMTTALIFPSLTIFHRCPRLTFSRAAASVILRRFTTNHKNRVDQEDRKGGKLPSASGDTDRIV
jgi:hypothetical protein